MDKNAAGRKVIWLLDSIVDMIVLLFILLLIAFGVFSLWDTHRMYQSAAPTVLETYKPDREPYLSFDQLHEINKDVFAWVTVYGTNVDYPVAQGENNDEYINKSATGEFALYGCPFLDSENAADFSDLNSIIYGHHMDKGMMFGDLDLFLEKEFFENHEYGNLFFGGKHHGLHVFAIIEADAYDFTIYNTAVTEVDQPEYLQHIYTEAKFTRDIGLDTGDHVVLLSTCAGGLTNLRYILAAEVTDKTYEDPFYEEPTAKEETPFLLTLPWWWYAGAGMLILLCILIWIGKKKRKAKADDEEDETGGITDNDL